MGEKRLHPGVRKLREALETQRLSKREFLRLSTLLGVSATTAYAMAGLAAPRLGRAQTALPRGGTLRIGMRVQDFTNVHAIAWVEPANVALSVVETLTRIHQDNITRPLLCESWEASDDLRTWDIRLRTDARWRSGRPFVAREVVANFGHILDPATGSSAIGLFKDYLLRDVETGETDDDGNPVMTTELWDANAMEVVDDHTVRFNLSRGHVALPEDLFNYTNLMADPEENFDFGPGTNGTGAFFLEEYRVGERAVLRANPDYYGDGPYLDAIEIIDLGDDPSARLAALRSRQVDMLRLVDAAEQPVLETMEDVEIYRASTSSTAVIQMRVTEPPFDNPLVRKAMRLGIDPEIAVQSAVNGLGLPAEHHHVCPVHREYAPLPAMGYRPDEARALLAEAGFPDGIDITMHCKTEPAWELRCMQVVQQMYAGAGIRMELDVMPSAQFWDVWNEVPLGFVEWLHRPLAITVLGLGYRTGVPWNAFNYSDPEFDRLLTQAESTLDIEERRAVMERIERLLQESGPIAQPLWRDTISGAHRRVRNFELHPASWVFFDELALEPA